MAPIKLLEVLSYSSEDLNFPADNLLRTNAVSNWKCKSGISDKQSYVILKLEKLSQISAIDIGNEHSAFIEVLVGRDGVDFQVLLVASSFMSPIESRSSTETRKVRMFRKDKLNKVVMDQKWDRIKVICTQPFNKNVQYGLSFIRVVAGGEQEEITTSQSPSIVRLGNFVLNEEKSTSNDISAGSFFAKRKEKESLLTGPAAIHTASNVVMTSPPEPNKRRLEALGNVHDEEFYQLKKSPKVENSKAAASVEKKKESTAVKTNEVENIVKTPKHDKQEKKTEQISMLEEKEEIKGNKKKEYKIANDDLKRKDLSGNRRSKERVGKRQTRPFGILMKGVIFVMSGYQNPKRSDLRDKLLKMGGKFKNDWDDNCTHLICAFTNTPKFQAVKGKGKIVTEKWIEDCYKKKIRLPWRRYNLEKNGNLDESEEEVWADELINDTECGLNGKMEVSNKQLMLEESYNVETDEDEVDTDEEVQRILAKESNIPKRAKKYEKENESFIDANSDDEYDADTDVDEDSSISYDAKFSLPELQSYFKNSNFFIYDDLLNEKKREISRYIVAYDGKLFDYMDKKVNFVIADGPWDENFNEALASNPALQFVKSQWIWRCCDKQKFIPPQPYLIMPAMQDSD